jgi:hypothetical protein
MVDYEGINAGLSGLAITWTMAIRVFYNAHLSLVAMQGLPATTIESKLSWVIDENNRPSFCNCG